MYSSQWLLLPMYRPANLQTNQRGRKSTLNLTNCAPALLLITTIINIVPSTTGQSLAHLTSRNLFWSRSDSSNSPPEFQEPIGNHTVAIGRDAQLSCKISNLGSYRTAWLRVEDKGILTIHNNTITRNYRIGLVTTADDNGASGFVLHIKNVQPSDRGGYMCQINSVPMKYAIGYLDVLTPPQFDLDATGSVTTTLAPSEMSDARATGGSSGAQVSVVEGSNATLSCQASGHPAPIITWRREDGQSILMNGPDSDGVQKVDGVNTLVLPRVHRLNAGAYLCIASNGVQPSASKRQVLDVKYSPTITVAQTEVGITLIPANNPLQQQQRAMISCSVELNPLGSYHWFKLTQATTTTTTTTTTDTTSSKQQWSDDSSLLDSGDELSNSDKFEIVIKLLSSEKVQMQLFIRKLDRSDMAYYKCIARNSIGHQSSTVRLFEVPATSGSSRTSGLLVTNTGSDDINHLNDQSMDPSAIMSPSSSQSSQRSNANNQRAHTRSSWLVHGGRQVNSLGPSGANSNRWQPSAQSSSASSTLALVPSNLLHLSIAMLAIVATVGSSLMSPPSLSPIR